MTSFLKPGRMLIKLALPQLAMAALPQSQPLLRQRFNLMQTMQNYAFDGFTLLGLIICAVIFSGAAWHAFGTYHEIQLGKKMGRSGGDSRRWRRHPRCRHFSGHQGFKYSLKRAVAMTELSDDGTLIFPSCAIEQSASHLGGLTADEMWATLALSTGAGLVIGIPAAILTRFGHLSMAPPCSVLS